MTVLAVWLASTITTLNFENGSIMIPTFSLLFLLGSIFVKSIHSRSIVLSTVIYPCLVFGSLYGPVPVFTTFVPFHPDINILGHSVPTKNSLIWEPTFFPLPDTIVSHATLLGCGIYIPMRGLSDGMMILCPHRPSQVTNFGKLIY